MAIKGLIYSRLSRYDVVQTSAASLRSGGTILGTSRTAVQAAGYARRTPTVVDKVRRHGAYLPQAQASIACSCWAATVPPKRRTALRQEGLNVIAPSQDHRQRHLGHRHDLWLHRARSTVATEAHRRHPHHCLEPWPRLSSIEIMGHKVGWMPLARWRCRRR